MTIEEAEALRRENLYLKLCVALGHALYVREVAENSALRRHIGRSAFASKKRLSFALMGAVACFMTGLQFSPLPLTPAPFDVGGGGGTVECDFTEEDFGWFDGSTDGSDAPDIPYIWASLSPKFRQELELTCAMCIQAQHIVLVWTTPEQERIALELDTLLERDRDAPAHVPSATFAVIQLRN